MTAIHYENGDSTRYEYDLAGQIIKALSKDASLSFEYHSLGRLTAQTDVSLEKTMSFNYDTLGNRTTSPMLMAG